MISKHNTALVILSQLKKNPTPQKISLLPNKIKLHHLPLLTGDPTPQSISDLLDSKSLNSLGGCSRSNKWEILLVHDKCSTIS
jgi:hypothetical protein